MHWSFCRKQEDLEMKLNNFGHSDKTKDDPFFHNWQLVTLDNFTQLRNFKTSGYNENAQWEKLIRIPKEHLWNVAKQQTESIL